MRSAKTVEEMIAGLPREEQIMVQRLRALVVECLPMVTEKGYYGEGVPFFTHHKMICFIWPASVSLGAKKERSIKKEGVSLGFCQGHEMSNEDGLLQMGKRKQIGVLHFQSLSDIRDEQVRALLFEAGMIDDGFGENKKSKTPAARSRTKKR